MKKLFLIAPSFLLMLFLFACNKKKKTLTLNQDSQATITTKDMLKLNNQDYTKEWKTIDSLDRKGLPKSALEKVDKLYEKVVAENNAPQIVKCLMYKGKYQTTLEEDGFANTLREMESHIDKAAFPHNKILESMMAELYTRYLDQNYWKFQNRTGMVDFEPYDFETWTIEQLTDRSRELYLSSINDENTKRLALKDFQAILSGKVGEESFQPTLYDFLTYRAINHFSNDRNYLTKPAYQFYINQPEALADLETFINYSFTSRDSTSGKLLVLQLLQKLLDFHKNDEQDLALNYANMRRIAFVYQNTILPEKDKIYLETLEKLKKQYEGKVFSTEVDYKIAEYYYQSGNSYKLGDSDEKRLYWKKALEICDRAIEAFPESYGAAQCGGLKASILSKSLSFIIESFNIPNEAILMNVNYRNIEKVHGRIIKMTDKQIKKFQQLRWDERADYIRKLDPIKGFAFDLQVTDDYRGHSTEIKVAPLAVGHYMMVLSNDSNLKDKSNALQYAFFNVTNIAFANRINDNKKAEFVVTNRKTSEPMAGVKATFYRQNYNSILRRNEETKIGEALTDKNGFVVKPGKGEPRFKTVLSKGDDVLDLNVWSSDVVRNYDSQARKTMSLYLDRAIYRPGQTIYFKGLAIAYDTKRRPTIITNEKVTVEFRDVNNQEIEKLELRTNEYGTINGAFTAPTSGLAGNMRISIQWSGQSSTKYVRVEEYKRPKFEATFDPVKGSFKLGEEVIVKGKAKAYAGSNIDGAKVVYRVVREARFPYYPWWRYGGWRPSVPAMEITNGELKTDEKGEFEIEFEAIPDLSIDPSTKPQYYYTVYADVIDITGETHSAQRKVIVGTVALSVNFDVGSQVNSDSLQSTNISTKNLNGEFEAAKGNFKIEKLKTPAQSYVARYWPVPDKPIINKADFVRDFPRFAYKDEDQVANWTVEQTVFNADFDTEQSKELSFDNIKLVPGKYAFHLSTQDAFGEKIEIKRFVTVYDLDSKRVPTNEIYFHVVEQNTFEPGEVADIYFGSFDPNVKMLFEVEHDNKLIKSDWLTINELRKESQAIEEVHRGNLFYNIYFTKDSRFYNNAYTINVPWTNKELSIEYSTFRDKLYPGQDETWELKISGPKKEKVMAEMVAGMYDASLDAFAPNNWSLNPHPYMYKRLGWRHHGYGTRNGNEAHYNWGRVSAPGLPYRVFESLNWFGFNNFQYFGYVYKDYALEEAEIVEMDGARGKKREAPAPTIAQDNTTTGGTITSEQIRNLPTKDVSALAAETAGLSSEDDEEGKTSAEEQDNPPQIRTNLNETVFFFPNVKTDEEGNVILQFKMNEALTRWKFMGFAHTKDLKLGFTTKEVVTQKDLMVLPNPPRFFREGDEIEFTAKVSNLTDKEISGIATLQLFDAVSMQAIDQKLGNNKMEIPFTARAGQSDRLAWKLKIPIGQLGAVTHRIVAKAANFSDGEESALPVITNRMMVTETMPLPVRGGQTKNFDFKAMEKASRSNTLTQHAMTLEFTSNPAWYAVQALPYLMEYPYECTEQIFSRYYANALASSVANSHPKIKRVFEQWKGTDAMDSKLTKNQELKSALLEETPWVLQAQSEEQQRRNIALLFDLNRMNNEFEAAIKIISDRQLANGGFAWFPGGRDNWYITQYIVEGMGHLDRLGVQALKDDPETAKVIDRALTYIDFEIKSHYEELKERLRRNKGNLEKDHLDYIAIHYLYTRSFFMDKPIDQASGEALDYYLGQAEKYWLRKGNYSEGMIALALKRFKKGDAVPTDIVKSLKERSINNEEFGMYWKYNSGFYWYQMPIETHALMIEVFDEVAQDAQAVDDLRVWLLKNKQTNHWKTTKATASAVYALLMNGDNWLLEDQPVKITLGNELIDQSKLKTEAGTGYFKKRWDGAEVKSEMSKVKVENPNKVVAWGALYWQYFEQLDKIETFEDTPLKINKKLFKVTNTDTGPKMSLLKEGAQLQPGDKLQVRIEIRVDRAMEYVHMKDMRASGFEPINVLSTYKWQGGLGYYESTGDIATNFFFSYLPKGTYVFEYPLRVIHNGDFSNGITTIQSMYAPEFTSHSEGIRVQVGE